MQLVTKSSAMALPSSFHLPTRPALAHAPCTLRHNRLVVGRVRSAGPGELETGIDGKATKDATLPPSKEESTEDIIASKELVAELLDSSAFGTRGEVWLAGQVVAFIILLVPPAGLTSTVDSLALLCLLAGVGLMTYAFLGLGRNLSPLPEPRKKHELVVSGIYGYVRHPMYGGLLAFAIGLAVLTHNETRLAMVPVLWWILENKVVLEEQALSERYPEYAEYRERVKKFFPYIY